MSLQNPMRGIYTIPSTPFNERWEVDTEALRRVVDFCVDCGAHGLVYPVNASGFTSLSDAERLAASRIVVEQCAGRIPVVLGVAGVCKEHAAMFGREAEALRADGVIAMTPYLNKLHDEALIVEYYRSISDVVSVPIFIQNHAVGTELSVGTLARIVCEVERVEYIKEETFPATHKLSQTLEKVGPKLKGIFGGAGGRFLLLEHPRGVAGQMPGCHVTDVVVALWNALEAGERDEAKRIYGALSPLFAFETQTKGSIYKEVLRRRGVVDSARSRNVADAWDDFDRSALEEILADLEPLFTWRA
jgi:4-hydroxy-tetrahydrodipicolinate synthase